MSMFPFKLLPLAAICLGIHLSAQSASPTQDALSILENPFKYSCYYADLESGMNYCMARYYLPEIMAFTTLDTYNVPNRFHYCGNDPVNYIDPTRFMYWNVDEKGAEADMAQYCRPRKRNVLFLIDIDGVLITKNHDRTFSRVPVQYIRDSILKSSFAMTLTAGCQLRFEENITDNPRDRAVRENYPELYFKPSYSIYELARDNVPCKLHIGDLPLYSKFLYIVRHKNEFNNFDRITLIDDDIGHVSHYISNRTKRRLVQMRAKIEFWHVTSSGIDRYYFDKKCKEFIKPFTINMFRIIPRLREG